MVTYCVNQKKGNKNGCKNSPYSNVAGLECLDCAFDRFGVKETRAIVSNKGVLSYTQYRDPFDGLKIKDFERTAKNNKLVIPFPLVSHFVPEEQLKTKEEQFARRNKALQTAVAKAACAPTPQPTPKYGGTCPNRDCTNPCKMDICGLLCKPCAFTLFVTQVDKHDRPIGFLNPGTGNVETTAYRGGHFVLPFACYAHRIALEDYEEKQAKWEQRKSRDREQDIARRQEKREAKNCEIQGYQDPVTPDEMDVIDQQIKSFMKHTSPLSLIAASKGTFLGHNQGQELYEDTNQMTKKARGPILLHANGMNLRNLDIGYSAFLPIRRMHIGVGREKLALTAENYAQTEILADDPRRVQQGKQMGGMKITGSYDNKSCCLVEYIDALSMVKQGKLKFSKDMVHYTRKRLMKDFDWITDEHFVEPAFDCHKNAKEYAKEYLKRRRERKKLAATDAPANVDDDDDDDDDEMEENNVQSSQSPPRKKQSGVPLQSLK